MKFNTQVCTTRDQSERLLSLGLKEETADCHHWYAEGKDYTFIGQNKDANGVPAWSLHRLITMLPIWIKEHYILDISGNQIHYRLLGRTEYGISRYSFDKEKNLYHNIIACIEWLIKEGYFNEDYLRKEKIK